VQCDHTTAFYSATPGGFQDMLIFGEEAGGNVRTMSLINATRVLAVITVAPMLISYIYDLDLTRAIAQFFIGVSVGAEYSGITTRELRYDVLMGLAYAEMLALLSFLFIELALRLGNADTLEVWLAFLPRGQAEWPLWHWSQGPMWHSWQRTICCGFWS
jgi:uncharacterized membrane protein AbrB (regulator of aidB expression)